MSNEAIQAQIRSKGLKIGNIVSTTDSSSDAAAFSAVTQLTADATGKLQGTAYLPIAQPVLTEHVMEVTGSPNGNIMTQTLVAAASMTTETSAGFIRIFITSDNSAIMSTGFYYIPFSTIL